MESTITGGVGRSVDVEPDERRRRPRRSLRGRDQVLADLLESALEDLAYRLSLPPSEDHPLSGLQSDIPVVAPAKEKVETDSSVVRARGGTADDHADGSEIREGVALDSKAVGTAVAGLLAESLPQVCSDVSDGILDPQVAHDDSGDCPGCE